MFKVRPPDCLVSEGPMKRPERVTIHTPLNTTDRIGTFLFWAVVLGWPLFVAVWRFSN